MQQSQSLLVDFLGDVLVELLPTDLPLPESRHVVDHFLDLLVVQVVLQLLRNAPQVAELERLLLVGVYQHEHRPPPRLVEGISHLLCDEFEEGLEVYPLPGEIFGDGIESVVDNLVFLVEAESPGGVEDVGDVALPAVVAVEVEHLEEVLAVLAGEHRVLGDDLPREDSLPVLLSHVLFAVQHPNEYIIIG